MWAGGGGGQGTGCDVNKQIREGIGSDISAMIRMRDRVDHAVGWENAAPSREGNWSEGLKWTLGPVVQKPAGKGGGWYRVRGGGREVNLQR